MKVAIYTYPSPDSTRLRSMIMEGLKKSQIDYDEDEPDIVITIGGDGTLLSAFHHYINQLNHVRFVGIHTGHLGFYTDWRNFEVMDLIDSLSNEGAQSVSYPLLDMRARFADGHVIHDIALNESTIKNISKTMVCDLYINHELFECFRGDGLCISTPTGSTAYNKAVGGAVMDPQIVGFQLAEMASLNNRVYRTLGSPVILGSDNKLTVRLNKGSGQVLTCDRLQSLVEAPKQLVQVDYKVASKKIQFARYRHMNFWQRVRDSFIGDMG